jgi:hypothetical protein
MTKKKEKKTEELEGFTKEEKAKAYFRHIDYLMETADQEPIRNSGMMSSDDAVRAIYRHARETFTKLMKQKE